MKTSYRGNKLWKVKTDECALALECIAEPLPASSYLTLRRWGGTQLQQLYTTCMFRVFASTVIIVYFSRWSWPTSVWFAIVSDFSAAARSIQNQRRRREVTIQLPDFSLQTGHSRVSDVLKNSEVDIRSTEFFITTVRWEMTTGRSTVIHFPVSNLWIKECLTHAHAHKHINSNANENLCFSVTRPKIMSYFHNFMNVCTCTYVYSYS